MNAKSKDKSGKEGVGPRYAVYDLEYDAAGGEGKRYLSNSHIAQESGFVQVLKCVIGARSHSSHGVLIMLV